MSTLEGTAAAWGVRAGGAGFWRGGGGRVREDPRRQQAGRGE